MTTFNPHYHGADHCRSCGRALPSMNMHGDYCNKCVLARKYGCTIP